MTVKKNFGKGECVFCGKEFIRNSSAQRFCSSDCRIKHLKSERNQLKEMKCKHCGAVFMSVRKKMYCSEECSYKANLENRRKKKLKECSIAEIAVKARKLGLSYGKYVSMYGT